LPQATYRALCHKCKKNPATYFVSAARQPLSEIPGFDNVRLGITMAQQYYLDLGKGPQLVLPLCDDCARPVPDDHKHRFMS